MQTEELKLPEVTEDDVLAGEKEMTVGLRNGKTATVTVKAPSWRTSVRMAQSPETSVEEIIQTCTGKKEEFLNTLLPEHLFWIASVATLLSAGVDAAKKRRAAKSPVSSEPPNTPTSLQPSAS
jgi:hypothetical protein